MSRRRLKFYLVSSENPSSFDIVREDDVTVQEQAPGPSGAPAVRKCKFVWRKTPSADPIEIEGVIKAYGTKVDLTRQKPAEPGTRKQELEKTRSKESSAKNDNLQEVAEEILANGPDSVCKPGLRRQPKNNIKKLTAEELSILASKFKNLPALQDYSTDKTTQMVELIKGHGIWIDGLMRGLYRQQYQLQPAKHFSLLIDEIVPKSLQRAPGISVFGKAGCFKFPENIVKVVNGYVVFCYNEDKQADPIKLRRFRPYTVLKGKIF